MALTRQVLIVEDDPIIAAHLSMLVGSSGYEVVGTADEFESALSIAEQERPRVALLDVRLMGTIDGITIGRELAARYDMSLVFVTANLDMALRAMGDVRAEFIGKPFSDHEILDGLDRAFTHLN